MLRDWSEEPLTGYFIALFNLFVLIFLDLKDLSLYSSIKENF